MSTWIHKDSVKRQFMQQLSLLWSNLRARKRDRRPEQIRLPFSLWVRYGNLLLFISAKQTCSNCMSCDRKWRSNRGSQIDERATKAQTFVGSLNCSVVMACDEILKSVWKSSILFFTAAENIHSPNCLLFRLLKTLHRKQLYWVYANLSFVAGWEKSRKR